MAIESFCRWFSPTTCPPTDSYFDECPIRCGHGHLRRSSATRRDSAHREIPHCGVDSSRRLGGKNRDCDGAEKRRRLVPPFQSAIVLRTCYFVSFFLLRRRLIQFTFNHDLLLVRQEYPYAPRPD